MTEYSYVSFVGFLKKVAKAASKKARESLKRLLTDEIEDSAKTKIYSAPLKYLHSKLQSGFRRGGYDYLRANIIQKSRKYGKRRVTVTEPIIRTKLVIYSFYNIKFYYSSCNRKNVLM